ncbi:acetate--CoA ligase family protein [Candidatus Micrarchaeota archaeon]|nr:acetate--CoA ligase family protein [Candidatus Micrarchaeota archaeon]MBU2476593.1 acetate--CoA ligase family protein [Candidatus Micrarchaeota archaeon]
MVEMDFLESKKLIEKYGVKFVKGKLVKNKKELIETTKKLKYPITLKIVSKDISHKSDVGGVALEIQNEKQALQKYNEILKRVKKKAPKAKIQGIFVQEFIQGKQVIVGGKMDQQFGPTILFGLGGIFVELMKDVSLRICPITREDAKEMISEIKGYAILKGIRGEKGINMKEMESVLMKVNSLMMKEKIKELDINPLIANEKEIIAVDARVIE